MKNVILLTILLMTTLVGFSQKGGSVDMNAISLQSALNEIKLVTDDLKESGELNGDFDVSVKFNDVVSDEYGFELKILFISLNRKKSRSIDNSFTAKYKVSVGDKISIVPKDPQYSLAKALKSGIDAYQNTDAGDLTKNGFNVTVSFTFNSSLAGEGSYEFLQPVTISASKGRQKKSVHTVTIDFKPKKVSGLSNTDKLITKTNELIEETNKILTESN